MEIAFTSEQGVAVAILNGRLDSATSGEAETTLTAALGGCGSWLFDLKNVEYVSSAGLRVFLVIAKRMREARGKLALCSLRPEVREVFDISGFSTLLTVVPGRGQGIAFLSGSEGF